jgi:hypothetical protein
MSISFNGVIGSRHGALLALALATPLSVTHAQDTDKQITRRAHPGQEILIRGFAEFDRSCHLVHVPEIRFVDYPKEGVASSRAGEVKIGPNWVGKTNCTGQVFDGVLVRYQPKQGFVGQDHFSFDVVYSRFRTVRASVDVTVD